MNRHDRYDEWRRTIRPPTDHEIDGPAPTGQTLDYLAVLMCVLGILGMAIVFGG